MCCEMCQPKITRLWPEQEYNDVNYLPLEGDGVGQEVSLKIEGGALTQSG
jgi:hypothetical protein